MYNKHQQEFINSICAYQFLLIEAMRDQDHQKFLRHLARLEHSINQFRARTSLPVIVDPENDDEL